MNRYCAFAIPIVALASLLASCSSDITRSHKLVYDMATDNLYTTPPGGFSINEGDLVSMELTNINPFVYDVAINQRAISGGAEIPPLVRLPVERTQLAESVPQTLVLNVEDNGRVNVAAISHFGDVYTEFRRSYATFYSFITFDEYLYTALKRPFVNEKAFKEELQNRLTDVAGGSRLYTRSDFINKAEEYYGNVNTAYNKLMAEYQLLDARSRGEVKDIYASAASAYNTVAARSTWGIKVGNAADAFNIVQTTPFTISSFKTQARGNVVNFTIDGRRKDQTEVTNLDNVRPFNLEYNIKVNGTWTIDFSSGLFMSNLVNESYGILDERGTKTILKKRGDILNYGPGVLMNFYYQPIGVGLGLGLYASNTANVQYIGGPSLLLGKDNRFCLNGGVTVGKVTRLADGLQVNGPLPSQNSTLDVVPTNDRLDWGWYAGVSYNFTAGW